MKIDFQFGSFSGEPSVVTVGSFDGVHSGHMSILESVSSIAKENELTSIVASFNPHPREVLSGQCPGLLSPGAERSSLLKGLGIDAHALIVFDQDLASMSAADYVEKVLVDGLNVRIMVIGYDHRFGRNREGNADLLRKLGVKFGFSVVECPEIGSDDSKVSSSSIRNLLMDGQVRHAAELLGRFYFVNGMVVHGDGRGKKIGIPTANLAHILNHKLVPKIGVYAVFVHVAGLNQKFMGMMNIGTRPTFNQTTDVTLEVHILDFDLDVYEREIRVEFVERIRDEQKFASVDHLKEQLNIDRERCNGLLRAIP